MIMKKSTFLRTGILGWSIFLHCCCSTVLAQYNKPLFSSNTLFIYNQDRQLPQNSIRSMCFDKWGFLWVATTDGLARFDGRTFKVYPQESKYANIRGFVPVNKDTIFAFPVSEGNVIVISKGNAVKPVDFDKDKYGLPAFGSFCFLPFEKAKCASSKEQAQLYQNLEINNSNNNTFLYSKDTFCAIMLKNYAGNNRTLNILTKPCLVTPSGITIPNGETITLINTTFVSLSNTKKSLSLYNLKGKIKDLPLPQSNGGQWTLYQSENSRQFFLACGGLLYQVEQNKTTGDLMYTCLLDNFIPTSVSMIINNNNNMLLVATLNDGLYVYKRNKAISLIDSTNKNINNSFYTQVVMPDNRTILTGTNKLFSDSGFIKTLPQLKNLQERVGIRDSRNNYWYINADTLIKNTVPGITGSRLKFGLREITYIFEDHKKRIWISGDNDWGYFANGGNDFTDMNLLKNYKRFDSIGRIYSILEKKDGSFLLGGSKGIFAYNPDQPKNGYSLYGLKDIEVRHIEIDTITGQIWAGTKGKGICSFKDNGKTISFFPQDRYGSMRTVHHFLTDKNGMTWISTNDGLFVTTRKSLLEFDSTGKGNPFYYKYSKTDGLITNEFNGACENPMVLLPDGYLSISSINGLARINTAEFRNPFSGGSLFLENKTASGAIVLDNGSTYTLNHNNNSNINFTLNFADWNEDYNIETSYRFGNSDDSSQTKWQPLAGDYTINFPYLATGNYLLTVRKRTGFGSNDYIYSAITIKVIPLWYETKWFYISLLLPLLLLVQLIVHLRNRNLKKANLLLNTRITNATIQLEDTNAELTQLNDTKNRLITLFNHDLSVPLFYVNQMMGQMAEDEKLRSVAPSFTENMLIMTNTMSDLNVLMGDLLYWVKIQQHNLSLELEEDAVDVFKIIDRTLNLFKFRIESNNIKVTTEIEKPIIIITDERLFLSILYNVISNAIKFTKTGFLNIRLFTNVATTNQFSLIFENSTLTKEKTASLNSAITDSDIAGTEAVQSRGIGLLLVEDFASMLDFTINYKFNDNGIFTVLIRGNINKDKPDKELLV